jgi:hypothetical protein
MRDLLILAKHLFTFSPFHLFVTPAKSLRPGAVRAIAAECLKITAR